MLLIRSKGNSVKEVEGRTHLCIKHGGRRCTSQDCTKPARRATEFCGFHGERVMEYELQLIFTNRSDICTVGTLFNRYDACVSGWDIDSYKSHEAIDW